MRLRGNPTGLSLLTLAVITLVISQQLAAQSQAKAAHPNSPERSRYEIDLELDFDGRSYSGRERLLWVNRTDRSIAVLYFHLYSNLRSETTGNGPGGPPVAEPDQPRLDITRVTLAGSDSPLPYSLDDQGTTLRVNLRESVAAGGNAEINISFKGTVPEIDPDETGLTTHVVKQVSAALRGEKEVRQARDINFRSRGVMLLSTAYPVLAVHDGDEWRRKLEPGVGDFIFNDVADYQVTIATAPGVAVFTSAPEIGTGADPLKKTFSASRLRDFAVVAGRSLRMEETQVDQQRVRSIFIAEHERVGKRALNIAVSAVRVFTARFGRLPFDTISVVESPLVAGLGSHEFSGLSVIASAFYVDFDSPAMRNLPEIIREQRPAVEQSLEWTIAHLMAHQWWGVVVGSDPSREAVLDEGLSSWAALLYYRDTHGDTVATAVLEDELRGVYRLYRTFGGDDMDANRPTREYRNSFQYEAIVSSKGALMFIELRRLLGDEKFFAALRSYYKANSFEVAELEDLRGALIAEAPIDQRRTIARTFTRWLASKRGDEDIARPDQALADSLGLPTKPEPQRGGDRNAFTAFAKLGKFFWQQMTRIR